MVKSLYSGVSGLKTHQSKMDVIGNNIANVNTTGFKAGVVTFKDVYYQNKINPSAGTSTLGGVNPAQVGYGVRLNSTVANMTQSGFTYTDSKWDMALDGEGFFQVMDGSGNIFYTRAGAFSVDADGYLVNASGYHVLGVTGDSAGVEPSSEAIRIIIPDTDAHASSATKKVNGTNVTLSMSAPSDNTDMTVTFNAADYPYATYANGILNIFFDRNAQYTSQDDFEQAIATAIQAGGVQLPDDVELKFEFESIPDDYQPVAASNIVDNFKVDTEKAAYQYHTTYLDSATGTTKHAYMAFSVSDPNCKDSIKINVSARPAGVSAAETATYDTVTGTWTLNIYDDTTAAEINSALKAEIARQESAGEIIPSLSCDSMVLPSGEQRATVLNNMVAGKTVQLVGGKKDGVTLDLEVQEEGAFANEYKVTFAYTSGYGKTKAVWDENNLTITVSNDTTIADVNEAIKKAAGGDKYKMLEFNEISGLDYGEGYEFERVSKLGSIKAVTFTVTETDASGNTRTKTGITETEMAGTIDWTSGSVTCTKADGTSGNAASDVGAAVNKTVTYDVEYEKTYTVTEVDAEGDTRTKSGIKEADLSSIDWSTGVTYKKADGTNATSSDFGIADSAKTVKAEEYTVVETDKLGNTRYKTGVLEKDINRKIDWTAADVIYRTKEGVKTTAAGTNFSKSDVWQPVFREAFFSGNPSIAPANGKDSFFTETAKALSTFALEDGRLGGPQPLDSCDVVIQTDGTIVGIHPVHGYLTLGRIDVALFENPNGLSQVGGTNFAETVASGSPKLATAGGDSGAGSILSNTLEMSNVDLSQEFTDMITTQRGFQANSRVITVSDTMLEELLSLKR